MMFLYRTRWQGPSLLLPVTAPLDLLPVSSSFTLTKQMGEPFSEVRLLCVVVQVEDCKDDTLKGVPFILYTFSLCIQYYNFLAGGSKVCVLMKTVYYSAFPTIGIKHLEEGERFSNSHLRHLGAKWQPRCSRFPKGPTSGLLGID